MRPIALLQSTMPTVPGILLTAPREGRGPNAGMTQAGPAPLWAILTPRTGSAALVLWGCRAISRRVTRGELFRVGG